MSAKKKKKAGGFLVGLIVISVLILLIVGVICVSSLTAYYERKRSYVPHTEEEIAEAVANSGETDSERLAVVDAALTLTGKVEYFWGGKSFVRGWDDRWGTLTVVDAAGSETTGTERPFGLDCSGFVCWAFVQTGMTPEEVQTKIGNGTFKQFNLAEPIKWSELRPGDLVFQNKPGHGGNHVGICIGYDRQGKPLFVHCSGSFNNVVVTGKGDVFRYARRPSVFAEP